MQKIMKNCYRTIIFTLFLSSLPPACSTGTSHAERIEQAGDESNRSIIVYENNIFKEEVYASKLPESMRYRDVNGKRDNGVTISEKIPVVRIEILLVGEDGKLTTPDKAVLVEIHDYAANGEWLGNTIMRRKVPKK